MKMSDFSDKSAAELKEMLGYLKKELFNLRFQRATGELENTARFRQVRRDIARVMTASNAKTATKQTKKAA